jgi:O-antigen ligase
MNAQIAEPLSSRSVAVPITLGLAMLFAVFSWVSPNHYLPWPSFHGQLAAGIATLLIGAYAWCLRERRDAWPWIAIGAVATAVVPWLQWAGGVLFFMQDAVIASAYLLALALSILIGHRLTKHHGAEVLWLYMSLFIIAGALLTLWLALYQWMGFRYLGAFGLDIAIGQRPFGNFAQPNHMALSQALGFAAAAALYQLQKIGKPVTLLLVFVFGLGIAVSQSRAGVLVVVCIAAWFAVMRWRQPSWRLSLGMLALCAGVFVAAFGVWHLLLSWEATLYGASSKRLLEDTLVAGRRPLHWVTMIDAIGASPWWGYGWNQVRVAQYTVALDHPWSGEVLGYSHNLFLDLFVHNGIPIGALLTCGVIGWTALAVRRAVTPAAGLMMALVLACLVHSLVEFPLNYLYFLLPCGFAVGAVEAEEKWSSQVTLPRVAGIALTLLLAATAAVVTREYLAFERDVLAMRFEQQRLGQPLPRTAADRAVVLTELAAFMRFADMPLGRTDLSDAELEVIRRTALREAGWTTLGKYAALLADNGRPEEASAVLARVCKTQTAAQCQSMRQRWAMYSLTRASIAAVPFPAE